MSELRRPAKYYVLALLLAAVAATAALLGREGLPAGDRLALALMLVAFEALALIFPLYYGAYAELALHTSVIFATALLFPPGASMLLIGAGTLPAHAARRQAADEAAFNTAQTMPQAGLASGVLAMAGWSYLRFDLNTPHLLWAVPLAAAAMYAVDTSSVATAVGLQSERSPLEVWRELAGFDLVEMFAQIALGFLAALIAVGEPLALPLLLAPALAIYRSSERHVRLRERTQELAHRAYHDPLTGLPNRALFSNRLERALARPGTRAAVLFVDLDRFKFVNDSLGHEAGDELLKDVAVRLRESLRPDDTVSRHGGDEFTILLEDIADTEHAARIAGRITQQLTAPFAHAGHSVYITASIGVAAGTAGRDGAGDLLRAADAAMYRAKSSGKARYEIFDGGMDAAAVERLDLEADLRCAVEKGQFELYYQPRVSLRDGGTGGVEALLRWHHPTRGLVAPREFVPMAEETGLILPIGRWILREACRQAGIWRAADAGAAEAPVGVNLSMSQFRYPSLVEDVAEILRETGLPPGCLELEITESIVMEDVESNLATLHGLKALGVRLALDDFGTGYSSLSSLRRFPVDCLKIDSSFVAGVGQSPRDTAIIGAIITLATALGMQAVAQGVEREDQRAALRDLGCEYGQGYLFGEPRPASEMGRHVEVRDAGRMAAAAV